MKPKHSAAILLLAVYGLIGCAVKPAPTPSTAVVSGDIQRAQTATSQVDAKAQVILRYLQSAK